MDSNSVSPMPPEVAPMAEFDKTPPTPPEDTLPMDDLPPPPTAVSIAEEKEKEAEAEAEGHRQQQSSYDENNTTSTSDWGFGNWFEYTAVIILSAILLLGSLVATIFWVWKYQGFFKDWRENPETRFNFHPVLMIAGFVTCSGFAMLLYRICRCCERIYVKLLHVLFHTLAIPCIVLGFLATYYSAYAMKHRDGPISFYTLHSWIGLAAMGLFVLQFVFGFFFFLVLLCCHKATANFRTYMVPFHSAFGLATFILAVAACVTGFTQKMLLDYKELYVQMQKTESILVNAIGIALLTLVVLLIYIFNRDSFRNRVLVRIRDPDV